MSKTISSIEWNKRGDLGEAVYTKVEMMLMDGKGKGRGSPVRCKDFFQDAYWGETHGKDMSIHGYQWKHGTIDLKDDVRMALRWNGHKIGAKLAKLIKELIAPFNEALGGKKLIVEATADDDLYVIVDNSWAKAPWQISLLSLLMRIGVGRKADEDVPTFLARICKESNDAGDGRWLSGIMPAINSLLDGKVPKKLAELSYKSYDQGFTCHHGGGIYAAWTGTHTG